MGKDIKKLSSEEEKFDYLVLSREHRNCLRKSFLKILKEVLIVKFTVDHNLKIKEEEMAKLAKVDDITIPIFDGTNFASWKFRIMNILEYKECQAPAIKVREASDDEAAWKKNDLKAKTILISAISDKQLEYISECKTTFEMMTKLEKMYSTKSTALQIINRGKLEQVKLKNYNTVEEFFVEFETACNQLKAAGGSLSEEEKMNYIIKALPQSYSNIGDFIDLVPQDQRTVEYVKSKIKEKNMNKSDGEKKTNVSTFSAKTKGRCFLCGKIGHYKNECRQEQQGNQSRGAQSSQGRGAHYNQRGYSRGAAQRVYGRGKGYSQQRTEPSGEQHNDYTKESWITQVINPRINQVEKFECNNVDRSFNEIDWLLDSGCTDHIIKNDKYFCNFLCLKNPIDVKLPDGKKLKATKLGTVKTYFKNYYNEVEVNLKNVYFVEGIRQNLLSFSKITEGNTIVAKEQTAKIYNKNRKLIAVADKVNGLYTMKSFLYNNDKCVYANVIKLTDKEKWHRALGHVNFQYLNKLVNDKLLDGLPDKLEKNIMKCANCIQSKMANVPFDNKRTESREILELIHTDLNGPHRTTGYGGEKYFLTFIDDFSKCSRIYCIKSKDETASCFIEFVNLVENQLNKRIKKFQCDNGREYLNSKIFDFIKVKGIELLPCPPYVHELNGVAERFNRSAMDIGRCLAREAKINNRYWPEIMKTVSYLKNRTIANTSENKTPYEIFFGIKPNVKHLKIYGSKVFVRTPEVLRKGKWDDKAKLGVLVGYTNNSYRVLINNRVINARHVKVIEDDTELICLEKVNDNDESNSNEDSFMNLNMQNEIDENEHDNNDEMNQNVEAEGSNVFEDVIENRLEINNELDDLRSNNQNEQNLIVPNKSNRKKSPVERYGNPVAHYIYVNYVNANVPNTFEEALNSRETREWQKAMNSEIESLKKNKTWVVVDKPENKKIIDVKWVYKRKSDNTCKARLVVRGFQQKEYIENVYSPVGRMQTLKILLSYCCANNLFIEQMDVETAFLNGTIKSEVYIYEPQGYETGKNKVCKLQKALYGLRESPRAWYDCFNKLVEKLNFVRSNFDYCLYVNKTSKDPIYILVFVDDLLICCRDKNKVDEVKASLMQSFSMKDLGKIGSYIGIDIDYNNERNKMTLSQTKYIESLAANYNLENAKLYDTPMETNLKLNHAKMIDERIKYRNLIGELLYISTGTRPDIAYSVNYLSRFQSCYDQTHFRYAMRILKYLYKTKDLKLTYYDNLKNEVLDCMVDSDYAGDNIDRKSTTGFAIRMYGNLIYWKTRKQNTVTKCSTFAEYTAMSEAVTEVLFIKNLLNESFDLLIDKPIRMYEDNSGAVAIAKFGNFTKNSKHIEVQYHYVNENFENGIIDIIKIDSKSNLADMLTKSLNKEKFIKNRKALRLI